MPTLSVPGRTHLCYCASGKRCFCPAHAGSRSRASSPTQHGPCAAARACFSKHALSVQTSF
eukprot:1059401-Pleurochrysis_carterae.AAC.1